MIIRPLIENDIPELINLMLEFHESLPCKDVAPFDPMSFMHLLAFLESHDGFVGIAEHDGYVIGAIASQLTPYHFNFTVPVAQEFFWFVKPHMRHLGAGNALRCAMEQWAKDAGAKVILMAAIHSKRSEAVDKIYKHCGYTPLETYYLKEV